MAEVVRPFRLLNLALACWLIVAPWFFQDATTLSRLNTLIVGLAVAALSLPRGVVRERYGGWDAWII